MIRRALCAAAVGALAVLAWGWHTTAAAHANLRTSDPAPGAALRVAPGAATVTFTEPPEISLSQVRVLDTSGAQVDRGGLRAERDNTLSVELKPLDKGVYTVTWRVVSRADGHATAGAFAFGVGTSPEGVDTRVTTPVTPPPSPLEIAGRWLFIAGAIAAFGGAVMAALALANSPRVRTYIVAGAIVAVAGTILLGWAQQRAAGADLPALLRTTIGRALIWRAAALVPVLLLARAGRLGVAASAILAAAAMYAEVAAGHAAAAGAYTWIAIAAQWVHFVAAGVWIGGLGALLTGTRGEASETKARAIARFSAAAGIAVAVVAGTGTYRAVVQLRTWSALVSSAYGRVVLAKIVLLLVLAVLGARNRYVNVPAASQSLRGFRRVSRSELSIALAVFVATALLAGLSPPPPAAVAAADDPVAASGADLGHLYRARLVVRPGEAGPNTFAVRIVDYATRRPADADLVSLRFEPADGGGIGPSTIALGRAGDGTWSARGTNLSVSGRWRVTVRVQAAATSAEIPLEIATRCRTDVLSPGPPVIFSEQLTGGSTAQTYLDPGRPGYNEVHFTFFDEKGTELSIPSNPAMTAWKPGAEPLSLEVRRFSSGHFIASTRLSRGKWRFESTVALRGEPEPLRACFEQTVG